MRKWISILAVLVSTSAFAVETTLSCNFITSNIPYRLTFDPDSDEGKVGNNKAMVEHHPVVSLIFIGEDLIWQLDRKTLAISVIRNGRYVTRGYCEAIIERKRIVYEDE